MVREGYAAADRRALDHGWQLRRNPGAAAGGLRHGGVPGYAPAAVHLARPQALCAVSRSHAAGSHGWMSRAAHMGIPVLDLDVSRPAAATRVGTARAPGSRAAGADL